jgi:hypothetical protein
LLALLDVEAQLLALLKGGDARLLDRRDMDEDVFRAAVWLNETVSLCRIELSVVRIFETETSEIEGRTWRIC